ncbi:Smr/MutS family protein [Aureispira anguillae]|uniref:Smr/MutS family protein n=1 Tax=Aureispira anguillae TaxID=2864201 RepID=A0A916DVH1_9BACT|nr:Smr/MutS family protein [Aureispira anguillae]BDS15129.1 Smr/MutS family protein [Aureispira anguillae]
MFEIGAKIRFKYTGMEAEIVEDHMDGSYTVWLEKDEEESIAFVDDIVLAKDFGGIEQSEQQKTLQKAPKGPSTEELFYSKEELNAKKIAALQPKHLSVKKTTAPKTEKIPSFVPLDICPSPPKQTGCYLAFHQTSPNHYTIYLVNDLPNSFSFEFKLFLQQKLVHGFNKIIPANTFFPIGELLHEQFNDSPLIEFRCPALAFNKQIKLKYRKFIKTVQAIPLMGLNTYAFVLFSKLPASTQKKPSIKHYTNSHKQEQANLIAPINKLYRSFDLMDVASFEPELDLHAEKLVNDTSEFTARELYELQLEVLENFITKAVKIGLQEVFIIHGLGKGKLKEGVDNFLRFHGDIKSYKNEFHEKYGFGATKVILKK